MGIGDASILLVSRGIFEPFPNERRHFDEMKLLYLKDGVANNLMKRELAYSFLE